MNPSSVASIAQEVRSALLERFLRYVGIDTQSDPKSSTYPSTQKQFNLLQLLHDELLALGVPLVKLDSQGYVLAQIPATPAHHRLPRRLH